MVLNLMKSFLKNPPSKTDLFYQKGRIKSIQFRGLPPLSISWDASSERKKSSPHISQYQNGIAICAMPITIRDDSSSICAALSGMLASLGLRGLTTSGT